MPCISPDGKPTSSGRALLSALKEGSSSPEDIARKTGRPIYLVRSGLRELKIAGYVEEEGDTRYRLTDKGAALLK